MQWLSPMLATLEHQPFSDPAWVYERKLDGIRCLVHREGSRVELFSRNQLPLHGRAPELVRALLSQPLERFVADGELLHGGQSELHLFDVLVLGERDVRSLPLLERKELLRTSFTFGAPLHYVQHRPEHGERYLQEACRNGWEGVIAKRASSAYGSGRSRDWLKLKCTARQELVIGGFTDPTGSRRGFGALLVGHYADDKLHYAGKVGTGFGRELLDNLSRELLGLEQPHSPFDVGDPPKRGVHWVRPELVAEISFMEWTRDGRLRHPVFEGLRSDKAARDVTRER